MARRSPQAVHINLLLTLLTLTSLPLALAHDHTSTSSDSDSDSTTMTMSSSLHFTPFTDTLWFDGWVPSSGGAIAGACLGLFLLGVFERWVAGVRVGMEGVWRGRSHALLAKRMRIASKGADEKQKPSSDVRDLLALRTVPPFMPGQDVARGVIYAVQAALGYALMLAVMTYQAAFIIAIIVGLGVGETLFGRHTLGAPGAIH